jgi:hypothetical protein
MVMALAVHSRDTAWKAVLWSHAMFGPVAWAPTRPLLACAVGDDGALWQSTNGGLRWMNLTGGLSLAPLAAVHRFPKIR